jgi:hypothetical protein
MQALLALFVVSLVAADTTFFGCTLTAHPSVTTSGTGQVLCVNGQIDGVDTLACQYMLSGMTSNVTLAHWHVGTTATPTGLVTFTFNVPSPPAQLGEVDTYFTASSGFTNRGLGFAAQIADCANTVPTTTAGCYFNVHTVDNPAGELFCQGTPIFGTLEFMPSLTPNGNRATSTGTAWLWHGIIPGSGTRAWGYNVVYDVGSTVIASHIHKATDVSPATGAVEVTFKIGGSSLNGGFVHVSMQGSSRWPTISSDFDSAFLRNYTYVNVHTSSNQNGEIRGNFGITSSATTVSVSFAAVLVVLAKLFA